MKIRLFLLSLMVSSIAFADDFKQLSTTVVTATRVATDSFDLPLSIDSISGENVRDARLGANLAEVAPKIPGVVINWRGGAAQELSGCGIKGGSVYGKTDEKGDKVVEGEIGAASLFATIYKALGINPQKNYYVGSRPVPLTDPGTEPVKEVLA